MKIIYLHQYFNKPNMPGGTRSYEMALRMVQKGHQVNMITSNRQNDIQLGKWELENVEGINVHWLGVPYNNRMSFIKRIKAFIIFAYLSGLKAISLGADVIIATSTPLTIAIPAIYAKKKLNIPMVFEIRDLWPELPIAIGVIKNPIIKYFSKKLEFWAYKNSEQIIGLSPKMCEGIKMRSSSKKKVHNIPNSADIKLFQIKVNDVRKFKKKYNLKSSKQLVIYAGTLGKINGVEYLVEIAQRFIKLNNNVNFLIVGDGGSLESITSKAVNYNCLNNNLFLINQLPKNEMPALFKVATLSTSLFLPIKEMEANSANKFFDTLAAGKPIAINYGGWQKDLIQKHNVGLVLNQNPKNAAKYLDKLLRNEKLLKQMGRNSLKLARSNFSRDKLANKLIDVLESCVEK
jgi:glycosyltransferase involved in cell wall biosynthesis